MSESETPLSGGNTNEGVVRVGDTVRRKATRVTPTARRLLSHLHTKGFSGCPDFLGIDEQGREVLSYLPGETGIRPTLWASDAPLIAAAELLRDYHDATVDFPNNDDSAWGLVDPDPANHEVICHNDFAPYNFIYRSELPCAIVDFDLIGPGPRLSDVAYAAYWLAPLSFGYEDLADSTEADLQAGSRRLKLFCQTYGVAANAELLEYVQMKLNAMGDFAGLERLFGAEVASKLDAEGHLEGWRREASTFAQNRARIERHLG